MSNDRGAHSRYFGKLNADKMKIRGDITRKDDTPEYVNRTLQEVFELLVGAGSLEELASQSF